MSIKIRTFTEVDLNENLTAAMSSTVLSMAKEGLVTETAADEYIATHVCVFAEKKGWLRWVLAKLYPGLPEDQALITILRTPVEKKANA